MHQKTHTPLIAAIVSASLAMAGASYAGPQDGKRDQYRSEHQEMSQKQMSSKNQYSERHRDDRSRSAQQGQWLDRTDRKIAQKAMDINAGSIALSELAEDRARSERLQQFARNTVEDNRDANRRLASLSKNLRSGRADPTALDQWAIDRLRQIRDPQEFERAYTELMVARSQMKLDGLQLIANAEGTDRQLRRFAEQQIEDTRNRLHVAQRLEQDDGQFAATDDE